MSARIAIRDAYGEALAALGSHNNRLVVLEADVGSSSKSILFGNRFPERYFNVGIAELNMTAMAAGFASAGLVPFVNTFATFLVGRAADPINSLIAYDNMNVKLCGTYCGLSDSYDGASHHATHDLAFFRALPNMVILSPCDAVETQKAVEAAAAYDGPVYLRLSRAPAETILDAQCDFVIGKGITVLDGHDITIIATGCMVQSALQAAIILSADGISVHVIDMHTIKPIDRKLVVDAARQTGAVVTAEEHSIYGGLGSAVAEVIVQEHPVPMGFVGTVDYAESGHYEHLLVKYKLDAASICAEVKKVLQRK